MKTAILRTLMRLYPAAWRAEFGAEFEDVLSRMPVTVALVLNVSAHGVHERLMQIVRKVRGGGIMHAQFETRYDVTVKVMTLVAVAVIASVPLLTIGSSLGVIASAVLTLLVVGLGFAYSPRGYEAAGGVLRVKRIAGDVVFPLNRLRYVRVATSEDFAGCVRLWGSGGLFGYYGTFWSRALGRSEWYVTDRSKAVLIADADRVIVVSPDDREAFLAAVGSDQPLPPVAPAIARKSVVAPTLVFAIAFPALVLGFVAWAVLANPGRPPVDLTRNSLTIHSKYYGMTLPAASVDAKHVRVIDLTKEPGWTPVIRTDGFGNSHYRAGSFRTANGRDVTLYTTGSKRLVLLPPSRKQGTPVLLDTDNPDQFVARVQAEWKSE